MAMKFVVQVTLKLQPFIGCILSLSNVKKAAAVLEAKRKLAAAKAGKKPKGKSEKNHTNAKKLTYIKKALPLRIDIMMRNLHLKNLSQSEIISL